MKKVSLPSGLQNLAPGYELNQNVEKVKLPTGRQSLAAGTGIAGPAARGCPVGSMPSGRGGPTGGGLFNQSSALPRRHGALARC